MEIKLLLSNGKNAVFAVDDSFTISQLKSFVSSNWPKEWDGETVLKQDDIRILYRGRFLADSVRLAGGASGGGQGEATSTGEGEKENLNLPTNQVTTMHLVPKPADTVAAGGDGSKGCKCVIL